MTPDQIRDYARAVAEAVYEYCDRAWSLPGCWDRDKDDIMDEVFETVPRPTAQHHAAPTCDGWWWARHSFNRRWEAVLYVYDGNQEEPEQYVVLNGQEEGRDVSEFDAWVGPLLPPDTTEPAPDEELPRRGGGTIGVGTLAYFQANNENQLQQAMLRRVIALEKALGRERARALLCERLGVEAESLGDLLCARSDLDAISDVMLAAGAMFDVGVEVLPDLSQQLPIHGPVRLPSMPIVPQPAPDVQAVKLCNCGKCCPGPLYSQHERDAAVAREREEVQAHAPLYLEWVKEGALSADDALERLVIWLRARSAKGV